MKRLAVPFLLVFVALGCRAQRESPPEAAASPAITSSSVGEKKALEVAKDYAREKRWEIYRFPTQARFDPSKSEWRCVIKVRNGDFVNDFFVYVNDITGEVRHVRGE